MVLEITHLTFDCYGTLIDWKSGMEINLRKTFGSRLRLNGKELLNLYTSLEAKEEGKPYKKYVRVMIDTAQRLAENLRIEISKAEAERFANSLPSWPAFKDTVAQLKTLGRMGLKRYILSNVDVDLLEETIGRNHLEVDGFVTAEEVRSYKPSFAHWSRFLEKTGVDKDLVLHVAQSIYHDIIPASRLGIKTAWINRYRNKLLDNAKPLFVCRSLRDLTQLLDRELEI